MEKSKLLSFISKYSLGGLIDAVEWKVGENEISTRFMSDDDNLIGEVRVTPLENLEFGSDVNVGIANTSFLLKMLAAIDDKFSLTLKSRIGAVPDTLILSDGNVDINYMLADPIIIPKAPAAKNLPEPTYEFNFDASDGFMDKFIKAKNAFNDVDMFTITPKKKGVEFIVGNSVNKIKIAIKSNLTGTPTRSITFSSKYFKEILNANKEMISAKFSVYERGIVKIEFNHADATTTYFLMEMIISS